VLFGACGEFFHIFLCSCGTKSVAANIRRLIFGVEHGADLARIRLVGGNRKFRRSFATAFRLRLELESLTMLSIRGMATIIALTMMAFALGQFSDRNIEISFLLAGVIAILGVLTVAVLLLADMAEAVQALAHDNDAKYPHESGKHPANAVPVGPSGMPGGAIANGEPAQERRYQFTSVYALGNYVDIIIPSDRHK
jgi:hypothetical protein